MNIHLSIYPESQDDVIRGVLGFIRANGYPTLCDQWFDTDDRPLECIVSSYHPDRVDMIMEEQLLSPFVPVEREIGVAVDSCGCYRFENGKYYIITINHAGYINR